MKFLRKVYEFLITWSEAVYAYREHNKLHSYH